MKKILSINKYLIFLLPFFLFSCGDNDGVTSKLTKGHRDAIKIQCEDASNKEACNQEVRANFVSDGNEYADFSELTKDQIESVKWKCNRSRKYGLEAYNDCLEKFINKALNNDLFNDDFAEKPKNNIEKLELSTVKIEVAYFNKETKEESVFSSGSGIIISEKNIATNCHVALAENNKRLKETGWNKNLTRKIMWAKTVNNNDWGEVRLVKKNEKKDICILKHIPSAEFKLKMKPITKFVPFDKVKKGSFVRAMGNPSGMTGHTAEGTIQWKGTMDQFAEVIYAQASEEYETSEEALGFTQYFLETFDKDTKLIVHGAKIHKGSSGGPLFDSDGAIIGLNTLGFDKTAAENVAVSADHIKDLLYNN